jgi:hypothetical protein
MLLLMNYKRQRPAIFAVFGFIAFFVLVDVSVAGLPENNPVPGGVAVVTLPGIAGEKPIVRFGDKQIYVTLKNVHWVAVVGLPLDILPGKYILTIDTKSGDFSKKRFRIEPLPPSKTKRTVMVPEALNSLDLNPENSKTYIDIVNSETELDSPIEPNFTFDQIVSAGSYLPYGFLLKKQNPVRVINHPSITYSYLHDTILKPGESINTGDIVGAAKTVEGMSSGRVDWQLILNGYHIDPLQFSPST